MLVEYPVKLWMKYHWSAMHKLQTTDTNLSKCCPLLATGNVKSQRGILKENLTCINKLQTSLFCLHSRVIGRIKKREVIDDGGMNESPYGSYTLHVCWETADLSVAARIIMNA